MIAQTRMPFRWPTPCRDPFPPSSAGGLATLPGRLLAVARLPVDGPQVRIGVIIPGDEVIHLISAREPADVADAAVVAEDALALRVPRFRKSYATITVGPLSGSHGHVLQGRLERISPCLNAGAATQPVT